MISKIELAQARVGDLEKIHALVDEVCQRNPMDEPITYALRLCIEEAFVNIVDHGYPAEAPGLVSVSIETLEHTVLASVGDHAPAFHPEHAPKPDLNLNWDERQIGGLGWHFIRELMDEVRYEADDEKGNVLTLVKYLHTSQSPKKGRLEVTVSPQGKATLVAIGGRVDALSATSVTEMLNKQFDDGKKFLIADLGRMTYTSSAGVFALLNALKEARALGGDLRLANASREVHKVLELSGLFDLTQHFDHIEQAVASYQ